MKKLISKDMLKLLHGNKLITQKRSIIYYTDSKLVGGAENYLYLLLKNLNRNQFTPILLCPDGEGHRLWRKKIQAMGINVYPFATRSFFAWSKIWRTIKLFKQTKPQIIHFQFWSPYSCGIGLLLSTLCKGCVKIGTEHSFVPLSQAEWYLRPLKKAYQKWRGKTIDYPITVSYASRGMMNRSQFFNNKKISVVHNGIEMEDFDLSGRKDKRIDPHKINVVTVARLEEGKGHQMLIRAIRKIPKRIRHHLEFHLIGGGSLEKKLKHQIQSLNLSRVIKFWGQTPGAQKLLPQFSFFVFPSYSENFPFAIIEAMAAGLAIISTNVGGIKEALKNNRGGFLVKKGRAKIMAKKIITLMKNQDLRQKMGSFNRQFSHNHFSDKIMARKTEEIYRYATDS